MKKKRVPGGEVKEGGGAKKINLFYLSVKTIGRGGDRENGRK